MRLALAEIRRAKLRFGLLTGAVALLVFLILFQQTLAGTLLHQFTGAIEHQSAQVLVYSKDSKRNPEASIVTPDQVAAVGRVSGVAKAEPMGENTLTVQVAGGELKDATVIGYTLGGPGAPTKLSEGRLPERDGEGVASAADAKGGFGIGSTITVVPGGERVRIVGLAEDSNFLVQPTVFVSYPTYQASALAANPDAKAVLPSLVAVDVDAGENPATVAARITRTIPGVEALDRQTAVASLPGVSSVSQSFNLILLIAFIVVVLITGFFFLILTVQKTQTLTLLRAVGASTGFLLGNLALQVFLVTAAGVAVAAGLLVLAAATSGSTFAIEADPKLILVTGGAILALALLASVAAMRRVARLDPAAATTRTAGGGLA